MIDDCFMEWLEWPKVCSSFQKVCSPSREFIFKLFENKKSHQENSNLVKMATLVFNPTQRLLKVADILRYVCMLTCFTDAPTMNMDGSNVHAV
jgi:hypothetical protein